MTAPRAPKVLLAWIGHADLLGASVEGVTGHTSGHAAGPGPIAAAVEAFTFDEVRLLANWAPKKTHAYVTWLEGRTKATVLATPSALPSPTDYAAIYRAARAAADEARATHGDAAELWFHLSPGTPAMTVVWILLGKSLFAGRFLQAAPEEGVSEVEVPFDLVGDVLPDVLRTRDEAIEARLRTPDDARFADVLHASPAMAALLERARVASAHAFPVLLRGERGTGRTLLARAMHHASPRATKPFVVVRCGALTPAALDAELFGHRRGAHLGADRELPGAFEQAHEGTLYLDEIDAVPPDLQVRVLRGLYDGRVRRAGEGRERSVDVRVIAATDRDLFAEVSAGRFREDLFYRLAVLALDVPPLRARGEDAALIADALLERMQPATPGAAPRKKLARDAREVLLRHRWPGNVRELQTTLQRVMVWCPRRLVHAADVEGALVAGVQPRAESQGVLNRPLGEGMDLRALLDGVARHYLERAMAEAAGNKTKAAALVGLPSYQTLTNWLARYGISQ